PAPETPPEAPRPSAATAANPPGPVDPLAPKRAAPATLPGGVHPSRGFAPPDTQIGDTAAADHHAVPVGLVAGPAPRSDEQTPLAVERRGICGRGGSKNCSRENRRQRDGADGMADRGPRVG